jgi:hypothetical protein
MQEWRRLAAAGQLTGPPAIFFQPTKPIEELYDTENDPDEVTNLADDEQYAAVLFRLRAAHEKWRTDTADVGLIPEAELNEQRRPGGKWSITADPEISISAGQATIRSSTPGASLAYRVGKNLPSGEAGHWQLYAKPVAVASGESIQAKACRLGYLDSQIVSK